MWTSDTLRSPPVTKSSKFAWRSQCAGGNSMTYFFWPAGLLWIVFGLLALGGSLSAINEDLWTTGVLGVVFGLLTLGGAKSAFHEILARLAASFEILFSAVGSLIDR